MKHIVGLVILPNHLWSHWWNGICPRYPWFEERYTNSAA